MNSNPDQQLNAIIRCDNVKFFHNIIFQHFDYTYKIFMRQIHIIYLNELAVVYCDCKIKNLESDTVHDKRF